MCKNGSKGAHRRTKAKKSHNFPRPFGEQDDVLGRVTTGDETWVYQYDPEMKQQSAQWKTANSPRPKKFCQSKSRVKIMLLTFFDIRRIVRYEFVPTGQTVNQVYYLEVLEGLREKVRQKRPNLFANNS